MGRRKQPTDSYPEHKKKFTAGRLLALVVAAVAAVYLFVSVHTFYNFVRVMLADPDAAKQQEKTVEALDEIYAEEE
ncbi:MAG: hypothetical protein K2N87_14160 [Eubacterium sp.]|nr:hypothetical protein [Eubacterium sp.]